jgi:Methyltransferase FkbM domain
MSKIVEEKRLYKNYPLLSRIEWHLSKSRYFAYGMDHCLSKARFHWHERRRKRKLIPSSLIHYEFKVFSQNGEDGILQEILRRIGEGDKFSVEFGIEDGTECCTRNLLVNHGWAGLLVEGSRRRADRARSLYQEWDQVIVRHSYITLENILDIFRENSVPESPDLLVVDIDGNDYWVLDRILSAYRPRVIVCEYSARWTPKTDWVMPYDPDYIWDGSAYFGASLTSLSRLARGYGYTLVCCESRGVNSFFIRSDLVDDKFPDHDLGLAHYVPPHYGRGFGHPLRFRYRSKEKA